MIPAHVSALAGDSARYALSKAVPGLVGFAAVLVFVRILEEDQYGRYSLAFTVVATAQGFFLGWLNQAVLRYHSWVGESQVAGTGMLQALAASLILGVLALGVLLPVVLGDGGLGRLGLLAMLGVFGCMGVFRYRMALLQARLAAGVVVGLSAVQAVAALAIPVILFFVFAASYELALIGLALSYVLGALVPLRREEARTQVREEPRAPVRAGEPIALLARHGEADGPGHLAEPPARPDTPREVLGLFWRYGWALSFWFAVITALQVSDRYFIQRFMGFVATGEYAAIYDVVVRGYSLVLFPVTLAAHPRIMRAWNDGDVALAASYWRWSLGGILATFALLLVVAVFLGHALPPLVLPSGGGRVASSVVPLVIGGFLWQFALLAHKPLEVAGRTGLMLAFAVVALGVNVAMNYTLMPRYGVVVAAYALVGSGGAYTLLAFAAGGSLRPRTGAVAAAEPVDLS